jgi:hypothetical protein
MKQAIEMASCGTIHTPVLMKAGTGILPQKFERLVESKGF